MINKNVSLISLPSSNLKLTVFPDYKDHPFSWWERKVFNWVLGPITILHLKPISSVNAHSTFSEPENLKLLKF